MSNAIVTKESLDQAVSQAIAKEIINSLDTVHRNALLEGAIVKALSDWSLKRDIEKIVATRAQEVAAELVKEKEWTERITAAVHQGLMLYTAHLPKAVADALKESMHGSKGKDCYSDRSATILRHLNVPNEVS